MCLNTCLNIVSSPKKCFICKLKKKLFQQLFKQLLKHCIISEKLFKQLFKHCLIYVLQFGPRAVNTPYWGPCGRKHGHFSL